MYNNILNMGNQNRYNHRNQRGKNSKPVWFSFWGGSDEDESQVESTISESESNLNSYPLSQAKQGFCVWVVGFSQQKGNGRLLGMGLSLGVKLDVLHSQPSGSVIVSIAGNQIALGAGMANKVLVSNQPINKQGDEIMKTQSRVYLREMAIGTKARILGYDKAIRSYKGKLLAMGLTPNTEFTLVRVAPLGDPVEIQVRGFSLSLRKQEADALIVEVID